MDFSQKNQDINVKLPGQVLREAREQFGMSPLDMAVALNLSKQIIQNLEDNRYENLPGDTFIRGYLKLYCRKVDLPEEEVLVGFDNWRLLNRKKPREVKSYQPMEPNGSESENHFLLVSVIILVFVLGFIISGLYFAGPIVDKVTSLLRPLQQEYYFSIPKLPSFSSNEIFEDEPGNNGDDVLGDLVSPIASDNAGNNENNNLNGEDNSNFSSTGDNTFSIVDQVVLTNTNDVEQNIVEDFETLLTPAVQSQSDTAAISDLMVDNLEVESDQQNVRQVEALQPRFGRLVITFSNDCWVEVRNSSGDLLMAEIRTSLTPLDIETEGQVEVLLGAAHTAEVLFNDRVIDLTPDTYQDIAKLRLGNGSL